MNDFAHKLKALRELKAWSQEELASRLKVSRSTIGNYEQGKRRPNYEDLEAIADIFNCPISYLIVGDQPVISQQAMDYALKISNLSTMHQSEVMNYIDYLENKERRESEA